MHALRKVPVSTLRKFVSSFYDRLLGVENTVQRYTEKILSNIRNVHQFVEHLF